MPSDRTTSGLDLLVALPPGPRRAGVEQVLREAIREGQLEPGARVPSTRSLAQDLGVSRGTIVDAYAQLVAEGWLTSRHGSGTRVAGRAQPARRPGPPTTSPRIWVADFLPGRSDLGSFPRQAWM